MFEEVAEAQRKLWAMWMCQEFARNAGAMPDDQVVKFSCLGLFGHVMFRAQGKRTFSQRRNDFFKKLNLEQVDNFLYLVF